MGRSEAWQSGDGVSRWQGLISDFEGSGLSTKEFCLRSGIANSTFYLWRRRLGRIDAPRQRSMALPEDRAQGPSFIALGCAPAVPLEGSMPQQAAGERLDLRIDLGGGVVLHLRRG